MTTGMNTHSQDVDFCDSQMPHIGNGEKIRSRSRLIYTEQMFTDFIANKWFLKVKTSRDKQICFQAMKSMCDTVMLF